MSALKKAFSRQSSVVSLLIFTILFIVNLFIVNLFIFTSPVFAADFDVNNANWQPLNSNNYDDEMATQRFGRNILVFIYTVVFGNNPFGDKVYSEKIISGSENGNSWTDSIPGISKENIDGGALGITTNIIASLYNPPISSVEYLANFGENMGIAPKNAYAQVTGSGANVINPVLALWQVTRNIAYVGFILVFIAAGLMIMFRQKLNPQTVIGIQQALPGLIIGLILVTFSYFIAAFIVDLAFVGTRLVAEIFVSANTPNYYGCTEDTIPNPCNKLNKDILLNTYAKSDAFGMYQHVGTRVNNATDFFGQTWATFSPKPQSKTNQTNSNWWDNIFTTNVLAGTAGPVGLILNMFSTALPDYNIAQAIGAGAIATLAAILVPLILGIALIIQFIRLIIALLMSYLQILVMVIFGPFLILFSAIPGRGGTLGYWLKALFANVLVFPAVFAGFLFAGMLLQWNNEDLTNAAMPLFGGLDGSILKSLLAFGVLLGLPSIPNMIREALGVKGPQGFTQAALGGFMGGIAAGRTGVGASTQRLQQQKAQAEHYRTEGIVKGGADQIRLTNLANATAPTGWKGRAAQVGKWINDKSRS